MSARAAVVVFFTIASCGRYGFDPTATHDGGSSPIADAASDGAAPAPITFVQAVGSDFSSLASGTLAFTDDVGLGHLLIVGFNVNGAAVTSTITDTFGDAFTELETIAGDGGSDTLAYAVSRGSGASSITVTLSLEANSDFFIHGLDYAGLAANPFDQMRELDGTATGIDAAQTAPFVTTVPNELIVVYGIMSTDGSAGTGFTLRSDDQGDPTADMIAATPGSYAAKMTPNADNSDWTLLAASFRGD